MSKINTHLYKDIKKKCENFANKKYPARTIEELDGDIKKGSECLALADFAVTTLDSKKSKDEWKDRRDRVEAAINEKERMKNEILEERKKGSKHV